MEQPALLIEHDRATRATTLTLNRPARRNALNVPLLHALRAAVADLPNSDPAPRTLILRGAGPAFCAGLDLADTAADPHAAATAMRDALLALANCSLVTVAAVHGAAVAGGAGLAAACDFCVLADDAKMGYPEVRRGLVAALVGVFLRRQLRERDLRELLLTGELVPAPRALAMGLASHVVPAGELDAAVRALVASVAQGGPRALAATKQLLRDLAPRSLEEDCAIAAAVHDAARGSDEAREGAAAFLEKRPSAWQNA